MKWRKITDDEPEFDRPVWLYDGKDIWIGVRTMEGEHWYWCNTYMSVYRNIHNFWAADNAEMDSDYKPTHWMPLPEPPKP